MDAAIQSPRMTRDEFLAWAECQDVSYEFDGAHPVAMVGAPANHNLIAQNLYAALRSRLAPGPCRVMGSDAGLATLGDAVRFPDALVTCTPLAGTERLIPGAVAVFEILSPSSARIDRIEKVREYRAVPTILCYALLESTSAAVTVLSRTTPNQPWTADTLTAHDTLRIPALDIELPVADLYEDITFPNAETRKP